MAIQSEGSLGISGLESRPAEVVRARWSAQVFLFIGVALMAGFFIGWIVRWSSPNPDIVLAIGICFWVYGALKLEGLSQLERLVTLERAVAELREELTGRVEKRLERLREEMMIRQWRERNHSPQQAE